MYHCAHCTLCNIVHTVYHCAHCTQLCIALCKSLCNAHILNVLLYIAVHCIALLCASVPLHLDPVRSPHHPYEPWILWKQTTGGNESFSNVDIYIHMWRLFHKNTRGFPSFHLGLLSCEFVDFNVWICGFVDLWISICGFPIFVLGCEAVMCTPAHCSSRFRGFSF